MMKFNEKALEAFKSVIVDRFGPGQEPTGFTGVKEHLTFLNVDTVTNLYPSTDLSCFKTLNAHTSSYGALLFIDNDFKSIYCICGYNCVIPHSIKKEVLEPMSNGLLNTDKVPEISTEIMHIKPGDSLLCAGKLKEYMTNSLPFTFEGIIIIQNLKLTSRFDKLKANLKAEIDALKKELDSILELAVNIDKKVLNDKDVLKAIKNINDIDKRISILKTELAKAETEKQGLINVTKYAIIKKASGQLRKSIEAYQSSSGLRRIALGMYSAEMDAKPLSLELKDYAQLFEKYFSIRLTPKVAATESSDLPEPFRPTLNHAYLHNRTLRSFRLPSYSEAIREHSNRVLNETIAESLPSTREPLVEYQIDPVPITTTSDVTRSNRYENGISIFDEGF